MTNMYSKQFGKKERVLNYACQTYQLSRPNKVGEVMSLIRQCSPQTFEQWKQWYFENAFTKSKQPIKITPEVLDELGERLYTKITEFVIPEWEEAFRTLTKEDCTEYIYNLTLNRTYDGYLREKSVINDSLAKEFPEMVFEETSPELDHAGDVDYIAKICSKAIGFQIKPITAQASFAGYKLSERMQKSFAAFEEMFGGKVFIIYSIKGEVANKEVIEQIRAEIKRLREE
ncbi:MAG: MjaI family restriction endonuclease [Bacteroidales bacterium]|nr:MjaI family restriction endonuclease [Bacteroidales bacterium]MCI7034139.1 MjaI family restriction endonuclease [Bacteroidales bacterium]MDD7575008.1 MjaI family restriction endonuclease [Bacteroidales bacterium]MDY5788931.1 MjaI family restriction endonuclease [Candidatus Onthomorpha sp.]